MAVYVVEKDGRELRIHDNTDELSRDLAEYISELSEASIKEHGLFTIALSGGSLITLMRKLCEVPYSKIVEWAKWYVFWTDERVVAKSHVDSNYKLAQDVFFSKVPILHDHIYSINDLVTAKRAAEGYAFVVRQLVRTRHVCVSEANDCPKFDLVLLGMRSDGHVASLFPDHPALDEKDKWVTYMTDSPMAPKERITFTLPIINSAANVAVVATGGSKAEAVHLSIDGVGPDLPASMVRPSEGKLVWFVDVDAACRLDGGKFLEET